MTKAAVLAAWKRRESEATPRLQVGSPVEGWLRPLPAHNADHEDVRRLTEWRNRFVDSFLTAFTATEERTARWLEEVVGPDDTRILFMVEDSLGTTVGHMGIAFIDWGRRSGEVDAIVRGEPAPHGLMARALRTMLDWGASELGIQQIRARVRSDNQALGFFPKFGFRETYRVPLRPVERGDTLEWVEDAALPPGDPSLVHLSLER